MKLHILSDLHLNVSGMDVPKTDADVVILAGDIARPEQAVSWAKSFPQPILYVAGNHEFYGGSIPGTLRELKKRSAGTHIRVLEREELMLGGVRFLATTLWTDFLLFGEGEKRTQAIDQTRTFMRDFVRIRRGDESAVPFAPEDAMALFQLSARWLEDKLNERFAGPTVVITHHAPSSGSIHPRFAGSLVNVGFVSDLERLMGQHQVNLWIHGHVHDSFDYTVNGTRIVCNPRGYAKNGVNENPRFDPSCVVELA